MELTKEVINYIEERYSKKYDLKTFRYNLEKYQSLESFKASGNIFETGQYMSDETHYIMRLATQFYLEKAFKAMLVDLNDPNVAEEQESGNIGTPGRVAKVWCGADTSDDSELGSSRFMKPVRIATFPNNSSENIPITKSVDLVSACSHHLIAFTSLGIQDAKCIVSYIPSTYVLGISKLQRLVSYCSRRFWLQEDLTKFIYQKICEAAQTEDVYVELRNIKHGCEFLRGSKTVDGKFTSEYYGGKFKDPELRKQVRS